ncbi:MAG: hypothetical protein PHQ54_05210 [Candidatus Omnitrophica bacterium]|nr:hypothetical protein [Candidatus Omnitrophota bacterium]
MLSLFFLALSGADAASDVLARTPEDAIAIFDDAVTEMNESVFEKIYYAGEDAATGELIKKDFFARARFAKELNKLQGNQPMQKLANGDIQTAIENSFADRGIMYVALFQSNSSSDVIKESMKAMRLSRTLPSENRIILLQQRGAEWFVVHPYVAWNTGFSDRDRAFLQDRIDCYKYFLSIMRGGSKTAAEITSEYTEYIAALKTTHRISPYQW